MARSAEYRNTGVCDAVAKMVFVMKNILVRLCWHLKSSFKDQKHTSASNSYCTQSHTLKEVFKKSDTGITNYAPTSEVRFLAALADYLPLFHQLSRVRVTSLALRLEFTTSLMPVSTCLNCPGSTGPNEMWQRKVRPPVPS